MRFKLLTLMDITQTDARRGDDPRKQKQQQNFLTAMQTISMRSNPIVTSKPTVEETSVSKLGFGDVFKGKHKVWTLNFSFESESHALEWLREDFEMVPVITDLDETIKTDVRAFLTNGSPVRNTVFLKIDDFD